MQADVKRVKKRPLRMQSGHPLLCLLCYAIAFGIPLAWEYAALRCIYPRKLVFTAPDVTAHLLSAFPFLSQWLAPVSAVTAEGSFSLQTILAAREEIWLLALGMSALVLWLLTLLIQLGWRFAHRSSCFSARQTARAIRSYRLMMLFLWLLNISAAAAVWLFGVQFITGRTLWDYVVSFGIFLLLPPAAAWVSRYAAPAVLSGKHAFFHRI